MRAAGEAKLRTIVVQDCAGILRDFLRRLDLDRRIDVGLILMMTGPMTTRSMMTESTISPIDAVEPEHSSAIPAEAAASVSRIDSDPGVVLGIDPSVAPDVASNLDESPDSWRVEVAARLERYRTRRKPRTPRYPSLLLPFDAPESWSRPASPTGSGSLAVATANASKDFAFHTFAIQTKEEPEALATTDPAEARQASQPAQEQTLEPSAKVIAFPRSAAIPVFRASELADPVFDHDRPRIVEAPEILPPPPALGGMLIEPAQQESADRRADFASVSPPASPSASIVRRALAALVDGAVVTTSLAAFAAIFVRLNPSLLRLNPDLLRLNLLHLNLLHPNLLHLNMDLVRAPLLVFAGALGALLALLWATYEFLFVVYTGSTPGLRAAGLRLAAFDGSSLNRRMRCWRVLASFLSAFSAGLGYFWCILDQNGLCWHDRITRTHVRSAEAADEKEEGKE
jgi:uncharacterized RDD family membrane protein YckC